MKYYVYPKNSYVRDIIMSSLVEDNNFSGHKSIEYKGEIIVNLFEVSLELINFLENSRKNVGGKQLDIDVYSKNNKGVVRKHEFPRNNKRRTRKLVSKMKK